MQKLPSFTQPSFIRFCYARNQLDSSANWLAVFVSFLIDLIGRFQRFPMDECEFKIYFGVVVP